MKSLGLRLLLVLVPMMLIMACNDDGDDNNTDGDVTDGDTTDVVDDTDDVDVDGDTTDVVDDTGDEVTSDDPISLKFNGEAMSFKKNLMMDAFYYASEDQTSVGDEKVGIYFPGNTTGTFTPADGVLFNLKDSSGGAWWVRDTDTFTVTVTAYGAVGEPIEGTFSGTVVSEDDDTTTGEVTEGRFSVTRSDDS